MFEAFGHTDVGMKRLRNEDSYLCIEIGNGDSRCYLFAVADGMGGHVGGQLASELAIARLRSIVTEHLTGDPPIEPSGRELLEHAFQAANSEVHATSRSRSELGEMGTTLVAALATEASVTLANVGDSRAYLARRGRLQQITQDHSWKEEQARRSQLTDEEIAASPFRDMITRSLGFRPQLEVDLIDFGLKSDDVLLLCSDGIHNLLPEETLLETIEGAVEPEAACRRLIELANLAGGFDNETCVVARLQSFLVGDGRNGDDAFTTPPPASDDLV